MVSTGPGSHRGGAVSGPSRAPPSLASAQGHSQGARVPVPGTAGLQVCVGRGWG